MKNNLQKKKNQKNASKKKNVKNKRFPKGTWLYVGVLVFILGLVILEFQNQMDLQTRQSSTYLDSISLTDLAYPLKESHEQTIEVQDLIVYGSTLTFYEMPYDPLAQNSFYGRNGQLKNIQTGLTISTTFSGAIDSGFDLQSLPEGVYEVYLYDGYTPKRAYMSQAIAPFQIFTMRQEGQVKSIQLSANTNYLGKFNVFTDKPYLYISVTSTEPLDHYVDVILDPSSGLDEGDIDPLNEAQMSWDLAQRVKEKLENAGLKVAFSHPLEQTRSYLGASSRLEQAYQSQAKLFISLEMSTQNYEKAYCLSSPLSDGRLGNVVVKTLAQNGIALEKVSDDSLLNVGNGYDGMLAGWLSLLPELRETGGKATGTGLLEGWQENERFSGSRGMNSLVFYYASAQNETSRQYYLANQEQMAQGLAQGILEYIGQRTAS